MTRRTKVVATLGPAIMLAISPALIDPPWKLMVSRIRRRTGCASAVNTASYVSNGC